MEYIGVNGKSDTSAVTCLDLMHIALEGGVTGFSTDKRYNVPWTLSAGYMGSCTLGCLMLFAGCEWISLGKCSSADEV